jgi:hypothetical protein
MNDFNSKRIENIKSKLDIIIRKANNIRQKTIEPYKKDVDIALDIVKQFIIEKERIIYGGTSQNEFIKLKNKKDAFYDEASLDIPDYDIYSPCPVEDIIYITNKLFNNGFKDVHASEAVHQGTYTIRINRITPAVLDIHYMWNKHYVMLPKTKIGDFYYVNPEFMFIDLYKIYTDPVLSYDFRIEKVFHRCTLLEKYYPIQCDDSHFNTHYFPIISNENKNIINTIIKDYLTHNKNIIICGLFAYNFYVNKVDKSKSVNINYLSVLTEDINKVKTDIINKINKIVKDKTKVTYEEYHPFYEVFDSLYKIKYNNVVLFEIIGHMNRCVPYITVQNKENIQLQFMSFHGILLHFYSYLFLYKFEKKFKLIQFIKCLIDNIQKCRIKYLHDKNLSGIEHGIFAELIIACKFSTDDDRNIHEKKIQENMKKGKQFVWSYRPKNKVIEDSKSVKFTYPNTSGNLVNKN